MNAARPPAAACTTRYISFVLLSILLLAGCRTGGQSELAELKRRSAENWKQPPQLRTITPTAAGPDAAEESCLSCHDFEQPSTLPVVAEFVAGLSADQRESAQQAGASAEEPTPQASSTAPAAHPGSWLAWHPPEQFGCVACHGGIAEGLSLAGTAHPSALQVERELAAAGAEHAESALQPAMLQRQLRSGPAVYASCGGCHSGAYVPGAQQLNVGRQLIRQLGCGACHTLSSGLRPALPPGREKPGPALDDVGSKLSLSTLTEWPNKVHQFTGRQRPYGMPQYDLTETQLQALAVYLKDGQQAYGEEPDPLSPREDGPGPPPPLRPDQPARGLELLRQARCINCHALPVDGLDAEDELRILPSTGIGPSLEQVGDRLPSEWIEDYLAGPHAFYPGTRMPQYELGAADRADIAAWLVSASSGEVPRARSAALPDWYKALSLEQRGEQHLQGRRLFVEQGCAGCHPKDDSAVESRFVGPSLLGIGSKPAESLPPAALSRLLSGEHRGLLDYFSAVLDEPALFGAVEGQGRMPRYSISPEQREAIAIALLAEQSEVSAVTAPKAQTSMLPAHQPASELFANPLKSSYWPWPIAPQGFGEQPSSADSGDHAWLSLAERQLAPQDCGACHRQQYSQWRHSRHAQAMSPGITGQLIEWLEDKPAEFYDCLRCHARLSEQLILRPAREKRSGAPTGSSISAANETAAAWEHNPHFRPELQAGAHGCANCHSRGLERLGPLPGRTSYLWDSKEMLRHPLRREDWLRDSRFCADCHQFSPAQRVASGGPPLQDTYEEWRAWAAGQARPQSCQDCHMPDGDHSFAGIHDADFVRRSATVLPQVDFAEGRVKATLTLVNSNNGHHLPTYMTPRIWLQGFFSKGEGETVAGTFKDAVVGRVAESRRQPDGRVEWHDISDTRIPAGGSFVFTYEADLPAGATAFHLEIFVAPDHFYHNAYEDWLRQDWRSPAGKALLSQALQETNPKVSGYYLFQQSFPVPSH